MSHLSLFSNTSVVSLSACRYFVSVLAFSSFPTEDLPRRADSPSHFPRLYLFSHSMGESRAKAELLTRG